MRALAALGTAALLGALVVAPLGVGRADDAIPAVLAKAFPEAEGFGEKLAEPPVYPAYVAGSLVGYVFLSGDVIDSAGYSAKPLNIAVGLDLQGRIAGAYLVEHHEPILIIGVHDRDLQAFVGQYRGVDVRETVRLRSFVTGDGQAVDGITGATISSLSLNHTIIGASRVVARALGLFGTGDHGLSAVDLDAFGPEDWLGLRGDGSIAELRVTTGDVAAAFAQQGFFDVPGLGAGADDNFITLYAALISPAQIGRNLLGDTAYARVTSRLDVGDAVIFVGAQGIYSFKGTAYRRTGYFDRVQLVQAGRTYRLVPERHQRIDELAIAGAPEIREKALFIFPRDSGFDPAAPWRLELLVSRNVAGSGRAFASFVLPYKLPVRHLKDEVVAAAVAMPPTSWREVWQARTVKIGVLGLALAGLTVILVFQDAIARRSRVYEAVRVGALLFTLLWIGWYTGAQLSVVNVLTFANSLLAEFSWDFFLLDPLLFILWSYVAVALLFWGRGVFCGWLCPFGALQELVNRGARLARLPQVELPFGLHERLWPIKYMIFLALFALSLGFMRMAMIGVEVEPFKTAIILKFVRDWPWLLYALALLAAGLFLERFYCRYLCPLGAALAIPARLRMFQWLKRRRQCGTECHICAVRCPVQAIHPSGEINPNECIHCLKCQTLYYDARICPPLIARRKRREMRAAARAERRAAAEASP